MKNRIQSIDLLRGMVILLMALDHLRDFIHYDVFLFSPTDLTKTNVALFFTRFVTHFCAPVFCLLAGTSAYLVGQRMEKLQLSSWLFKRGLVLILLELTVIKFAWFFFYRTSQFELAVIWCLGICMIILAALIYLPKNLSLVIGVLIVAGHNLLDGWSPADSSVWSPVWKVLHVREAFQIGSTKIFVVYPFLPWLGIMLLGYHLGRLYTPEFDQIRRLRTLRILGFSLLGLFALLRGWNLYGDPLPWTEQNSPVFSFLSFLNVTKYPSSLLYTCITLAPAFLVLAQAEAWKGAWTRFFVVFGQGPMFFYILHLYVIHLIGMLGVVLSGYPLDSMIHEKYFVTNDPSLDGFGVDLWAVYLIWFGLIALLYFPCRWYRNYKKANPDKVYLSYF